MLIRTSLAILGAVILSGTMAIAQQKPEVKQGPIQPTKAADGRGMFITYCATCHGVSGKGDGPAAAALKKAPADLTAISARNGGAFPENKVNRYITGMDELAAHGSRDMPVWGTLFKALDTNNPMTAELRARNLTDYLRSIQK